MPSAENTFRPVGNSDERMHGATAVLVSGFEVEEQQAFRALMDANGLAEVPTIYIVEAFLEHSLFELVRMPTETRAGQTAKLPRAVIMSGLTEKDLHALMDAYRESGRAKPHWATVTPTTEQWPVKKVLIELLKESEALRQAAAVSAPPPTP
jgi:hypothetical protein